MRLFRVFIPASVVALLLSETILLFSCYVVAAQFVVDIDPAVFLLYEDGLGRIAVVVLCILLGLYFHDLYTDLRIRSKVILIQQFCLTLGFAFLVQALVTYFNPAWMLPRWLMITGSAMVLVSLPLWRVAYSAVVLKALGAQRVLFLGDSPVLLQIAEKMTSRPELGQAAAGYLADDCSLARAGFPHLGPAADLRQVVEDLKPGLIIVGFAERRGRLPVYELLNLRLSGIPIEEASTSYETVFGRVCTRELRPSHLVFSSELGPRPNSVYLQSLYSFLVALAGVILTLPVMAVVAVLVKLSSPGPILYRQVRVGLRDVPFTLYKFRSMRQDAEAATGAVWAAEEDPRTTGVGRWLRRLRLDELPQLFNVLNGQMSVVGPRPERPEFVRTLAETIPYYRQRHCVKPGITGWAQINYRYGNTLEDTITKLEFDLYYIKNLSFSLDGYIIFHTLKTMLLTRGAR